MRLKQTGLLVVLVVLLTIQARAQDDPTPLAPLNIELTEPRVERNADGTWPDGWDDARYERADGLIFGGKRITVREFIESAHSASRKGASLVVVTSSAIPFRRLQGVAHAVTNAKLGISKVLWTTSLESKEQYPLVFTSGSFDNLVIQDGQVIVGSTVLGELGSDFAKLLADLNKRKEADGKSRVELKIALSKKKAGEVDWYFANKKSDRADRHTQLAELITEKKSKSGKAIVAFAPDHDLACGQVFAVYQAAQKAGAEATEITNGSQRSNSMGFSWSTRDSTWLPRAIDDSLKALSRSQSPGGSWATNRSGDIGRVGTTALALLAFFGEFHTPEEGPYKDTVANGLQYLISKQITNGNLIEDTSGFSFDHVLGTYALLEAYGLTGEEAHETAAQSAFQFMMRCQNKSGAWGKRGPKDDSDLVVTAWAALALKSADDSGIDVPESATTRLSKWIEGVTNTKDGRIAAQQQGKRITTLVGTADEFYGRHQESLRSVGLLIRARCGQTEKSSAVIPKGIGGLLAAPPDATSVFGLPDLDYMFFGAMAMNAYGSPAWQGWRHGLNSCIEARFKQSGGRAPTAIRRMMNADPTTLSLLSLCLELSYRYTQTYKDD